MTKKKVAYHRGDLFLVPLENSEGYGLGLVSHMDGRGQVIGYFFAPVFDRIPTIKQVGRKNASEAIFYKVFGDLGFLERTWIVLGPYPEWEPTHWPIPYFRRENLITGEIDVVTYQEPYLYPEVEVRAFSGDINRLPSFGLSGSGAIEGVLTKLLCTVGKPPCPIGSLVFSFKPIEGSKQKTQDDVLMSIREEEHAIKLHLRLSEEFGSRADRSASNQLEQKLMEALKAARTGEFDGVEFGGREVVFFMYGPDAEKMFATIEPILRESTFARNGYAIKRYGKPGAKEVRIQL